MSLRPANNILECQALKVKRLKNFITAARIIGNLERRDCSFW